MELQFTQTQKHLQDLTRTHLKNHRVLMIAIIVFSLMIILSVATSVSQEGSSVGEALFSWLLPLGLMIFIWLFIVFVIRKRQLKGKDAQIATGERHLSLLEDKIIMKTPFTEGTFKWEIVSKLRQSKLCYFIYLGRFQAIIVPKEAFESGAQQQEFEQLVFSKIKK